MYFIFFAFIIGYSASKVNDEHLCMGVIASQVSDLCCETFLVMSYSAEYYTIDFVCLLSRDYPYKFCVNLFYSVSFLTVYRDYFYLVFYCSVIYSFLCLWLVSLYILFTLFVISLSNWMLTNKNKIYSEIMSFWLIYIICNVYYFYYYYHYYCF